jgi:hypothetical protein
MKHDIMQNWTTVGGNASVTSVSQDEEQIVDTTDYTDVAAWLDVRAVNNPTSNPYNLFLGLETAPAKEDLLFTQAVPNLPLVASTTPIVVRTLNGASFYAPLSKWLRWKVYTPQPTGLWSATFRIRLAKSRTAFFNPVQLPGCQLWLRSDVTPNTTLTNGSTSATLSSSWSGWADLSGSGNGTSGVVGSKISYNLGGQANLPYFQTGTGENALTGTFGSTFGTSHTLFVVGEGTSAAGGGFFSATIGGTLNTAFSLWYNITNPDLYGRTSSSGGTNNDAAYGGALSGYTAATTLFTTSVNFATGASALYINGGLPAAATTTLTITPGAPNEYALFANNSAATNGNLVNASLYEVILYNRALSADELVLVHRYLGSRYGIALAY